MSTGVRLLASGLTLTCAASLGLSGVAWAQGRDSVRIRGRVFAQDSSVVEGASVTAILNGTDRPVVAGAGRNGVYSLPKWPVGASVTINVRALGYLPQARRVLVSGLEPFQLEDFYLARSPVALSPVHVTATRRRRPRLQELVAREASASSRGSETEATLLGVGTPTLSDIAATSLGVTRVGDGFSVLGNAPDQNVATLNGITFPAGALPRDAVSAATVTTSSYDPSQGGYAGALLSLKALGGSNIATRGLFLTGMSPVFPTASGATPVSATSDLQVSGKADGPLRYDKAFYNLAFQFGRQKEASLPLERTSAATLSALHLVPDSVTRLLTAVRGTGLTQDVSNRTSQAASHDASMLAGVDVVLDQTRMLSALTTASFASGSDPLTPTVSAVRTLRREGKTGSAQMAYSWAPSAAVLNETRGAAGYRSTRSWAGSSMPVVRVLSLGDVDRDTVSGGVLTLGGAGREGMQRAVNLELANETAWYSLNGKHRFRLTVQGDWDALTFSSNSNANGSYLFTSTADVVRGQPSAFTKQLSPLGGHVSTVYFAFSLGDAWQPTRLLRILYGLRVEQDVGRGPVADDGALSVALGERLSHVPTEFAISPRAGFAWQYGTKSRSGTRREPKGTIRGGVGAFRARMNSGLLSRYLQERGGAYLLDCVGAGVPAPQWDLYASGLGATPDQCVSGAPSTEAVPDRAYFAPAFAQPQSWRGSLGWSGSLLRWLRADVDATYSLGRYGRHASDVNLVPAPFFTLATEANRPVFASVQAIDPTSGLIEAAAHRLFPTYGAVQRISSDLRSETRSLSVTLTPAVVSRQEVYVGYAYTLVREQAGGFDGTTGGDPRHVEWSRGELERRHQILAGAHLRLGHGITANALARLESGIPFTPVVAGDVNGDGIAGNDRAFVFSPAGASVTAVPKGIASLVSGPSAIPCLRSQVGRVARGNSCVGPWTASLNAEVQLASPALGLPPRITLGASAANVPALVDRLLHGVNRHGWGGDMRSDPVLLTVTGFDATARQFVYQANTHFGKATDGQTIAPPFRVTISARIALGPDPDEQLLTEQLRKMASVPGKPDSERLLKQLARNVPNIGLTILGMKDSLQLDSAQIAELRKLVETNRQQQRDIWLPFTDYLVAQQLEYASLEAASRFKATMTASYHEAARLGAAVRNVLSESQLRLLSQAIRRYFDEDAVMEAMRSRF